MNDAGKVSLFILVAFLIFFTIVSSSKNSRIESLEAECEELHVRVDELESQTSSWFYSGDSIGSYLDLIYEDFGAVINDYAIVHLYFEEDEEISFEQAQSSFERLNSVYDFYFNN